MNEPMEMAHVADDEHFAVDDDGKADWVLRQIIAARAERDRLVKHFKAQIEKAEEHCSRVEEHWRATLLPYMDRVPLHTTKTMSRYDLPSGSLKIKQQGPKYNVQDAVLVEWMKGNGFPALVKTKVTEEPNWADLKKLIEPVGECVTLKRTGEIIDGVTVEYREPKFEVEVNV